MSTTKQQYGVHLSDEHTTMTLPHRKFSSRGYTYYVATYPEGDLAIHESHPTDKQGYGHSMVTFLMEAGNLEDVLGPYECQGMFDHGRRRQLADQLGPAAKLRATRLVLGRNLWVYSRGPRQELYAEPTMTCDDFGERLRRGCNVLGPRKDWPADLEAAIHSRSGGRYLRREEIEELLKEANES